MNEKNGAVEIDLQKLLLVYLRRWWLIALSALIVAGGSLAYAYYLVEEMYQASSTIYVNNIKEGITVDSVTTSNLSASQQLVSTYISIVKSDRVLSKVAEQLDNRYTVNNLKGMVTASQIGDTGIFSINVVSADPQEAAEIANTFAEVVPNVIGAIIEGSYARVLDIAKAPTQRYSPSYTKYTAMGGLIGGLLAALYLTIRYLLDVRIKDEEELTALFDLPVLGQIPEFVSASKAPNYGSEEKTSKKTKKQQEKGEEK